MRYNKSPLIGAALGATFTVGAIAASTLVNAANPFQAVDYSQGYMVAENHEGGCGEGKCGANKSVGADKAKHEGKCGEGKCGTNNAKKSGTEGKCGEGKCGASATHNKQPG